MNYRLLIFLGFCGLMGVGPASAQSYQQLRDAILQQQKQTRSEISNIEARINEFQQRLNKTEHRYDTIYKAYEKQRRLLTLQKKKISSLQKERDQIKQEIDVTQQKQAHQKQKLKKLVTNYKNTLRYLYKNGQTSQLALILSSASINQMLIRNYYLKKFETYRQKQAAEIKQTQRDLKESKAQLDSAATHNQQVLDQITIEKKKLAKKTAEQKQNVALLRRNKQQIQQKLDENQQQKQQLNQTLSNLIEREERVRREERRQQQQANQPENSAGNSATDRPAPENYVGTPGYMSDAKLKRIENSFSGLEGQLPWPVKSHAISEHFGRHRNPVYGTMTPNLGIEIVTKADAPVHVVHAGYVFAVQPVTGYGDVVFVSHGKYKTAYGNLSRVTVRKNSILKKGDIVGYSGDANSIRGKSVFFMVRDGSQNMDPEHWLK